MRPSEGWAVFGRVGASSAATVTALDASGGFAGSAPVAVTASTTTGRRLFTRTNAQGMSLRGYVADDPERFDFACSIDEAVAAGGEPTTATGEKLHVGPRKSFGVVEGAPATCWGLSAASDVARVRVTTPDGKVSDEMSPVDGWAALGMRGGGTATIEAIGEGDTVVASLPA